MNLIIFMISQPIFRVYRWIVGPPPPSDELLKVIEIVFQHNRSDFSLRDRINVSNTCWGFYHRIAQPRGPRLGLPACALHMVCMHLLGKSATQEEQEDALQWQGTRSPVDDTLNMPGNFTCCDSHSDADILKIYCEARALYPHLPSIAQQSNEEQLVLEMLECVVIQLQALYRHEIKATIEGTERLQYPEVAIAHWIQATIQYIKISHNNCLLLIIPPTALPFLIAEALAFEDKALRAFIFEDIHHFVGSLSKKNKLLLYTDSLEYFIALHKDMSTLTKGISSFPELIGLHKDADLAPLGEVINSIGAKQLQHKTKATPQTLWYYLDPQCAIKKTLGGICANLCESDDTWPSHLSSHLKLCLCSPAPLVDDLPTISPSIEKQCKKLATSISPQQSDKLLHALHKIITQSQTEEDYLCCILMRTQTLSLSRALKSNSENRDLAWTWHFEMCDQLNKADSIHIQGASS